MDSLESRGSIVIGGDPAQRPLSAQEEQKLMDILNATMAALGKVQQYPTLNEVVFEAIDEAGRQMLAWLRTHKKLTFEAFHGSLQVNKSVLPMASTKKDFVQAFLFYLTERNIRTLEILQGVDKDELQRFFEFFGKPAKEMVSKKNLPRSLKRMGIRHVVISSELVLDNVIIKTRISDDLSRQLAKLNVEELLEKANIISQIDMTTLSKVGEVASVVTNLSYAKQDAASHKIIDQLAHTLIGGDKNSRVNSAKAFSQIAEKAVDYTLYDLHSNVGSVMAKQGAREDDPEVYAVLAQSLEKAAEVLIAKGDYDGAMRIIQGFETKAEAAQANVAVKKRADFALSKIASPQSVNRLIGALEEPPAGVPEEATVQALSGLGEKSVPALVDFIYTTDSAAALTRAMDALKRIGDKALPELYAEIVENMDDKYRVAFIDIIGQVGNVKSVVRLAPLLGHYHPDVKAATFRAMARIGGPAAENKMIEELSKGNFDAAFLEGRLREFGNYRNKLLVPLLVDLLRGKGPLVKAANEDVEVAACAALGSIGGPEAIETLSEILFPKGGLLGLFGKGKARDKVQVAACVALGKTGDPAVKELLEKASKAKSPALQGAAKLALQSLSKSQLSMPSSSKLAGGEDTRVEVTTIPEPPDAPVEKPDMNAFRFDDSSPPRMAPSRDAAPPLAGSQPEEHSGDTSFMFVDPATEDAPTGYREIDPASADAPAESVELGAGFVETTGAVREDDSFSREFDRLDSLEGADADFPGQTDASLLTDFDTAAGAIRLVITVGPHAVSNLRVRVPGLGLEGETDAKGVVEFDLPPGRHEISVEDQAFNVSKTVTVEAGLYEIPIDLQDIFNF